MDPKTRAEFTAAKEHADTTRSLEWFRPILISAEDAFKLADEAQENVGYLLRIKKLPIEVLHDFAKRYDDAVKREIAGKYPLLLETYEYLAGQSETVRIRLASNKRLPSHVGSALELDASEYVRELMSRRKVQPDVRSGSQGPDRPIGSG